MYFIYIISASELLIFGAGWIIVVVNCPIHFRMSNSISDWPLDGSWVQFSCSVVSNSLWPYGLLHARLPCPSPTPRVCSNTCLSSQWRHPTISSFVIPLSSCLQSFSASGSFPVNQFFPWGGEGIGASASESVLSMNIQDCYPLGFTGLISLQSKGFSKIFSNTTVQKASILQCSAYIQALTSIWEKEMATHSSTLAWKIPRTEEPGRL